MFKYIHKYFSLALLLYLLFLAILPCVDNCTTEFCKTEGVIHIENAHSYQSDLCSPLCNCLCCNTLVSISSEQTSVINNTSIDHEVTEHSKILPLSYKPTSPPPKA